MSRKLSIPQQVRVAHVGDIVTGTVKTFKVPIELGDKEIAVILAIKWGQYIGSGAGLNKSLRTWLYRKTEKLPPPGWEGIDGKWQTDSSVLDKFFNIVQMPGNGGGTKEVYIPLPFPYVLIRQPSILVYGDAGGHWFTCTLWYITEKVTDSELAQLMVKDHA